MDMARMDRGLDTGRAGALGAGSGREGLGWGGRGLLEVDDTATATAAATAAAGATFPAAMPTFTPRAASYHNTQNQKIRPFFFFSVFQFGISPLLVTWLHHVSCMEPFNVFCVSVVFLPF